MNTSLTFAEALLAPMDAGASDYLNADARTARRMLRWARTVQRTYRQSIGYAGTAALLTDPDGQSKLAKNAVPTFGFMLSPERQVMASGLWEGRTVNLCPWATAACAAACLGITSGHGVFAGTKRARAARTVFLLRYPREAGILFASEVARLLGKHGALRLRLNITSDIRWERVIPRTMATLRADGVTFYDYTKAPARHGYDITRSAHEGMSDADIVALAKAGERVAVVFAASKDEVRAAVAAGATFHGIPLVDGIGNDDRTLDPRGVIVALAGLGSSDGAASGFFRPFASLTVPTHTLAA